MTRASFARAMAIFALGAATFAFSTPAGANGTYTVVVHNETAHSARIEIFEKTYNGWRSHGAQTIAPSGTMATSNLAYGQYSVKATVSGVQVVREINVPATLTMELLPNGNGYKL